MTLKTYGLAVWSNEKADEISRRAKERPSLTGLYNWLKIFSGRPISPALIKKQMDRTDFVHVNVSGTTPLVLKDIARNIHAVDSKLVVNVDQAIDMWHESIFRFTTPFFEAIDSADFIFSVEPTMAYVLEKELKRRIECFPHPCDTVELSTMIKTTRKNEVMVCLHRYDMNFLIPAFSLRGIPALTHAVGQWDQTEAELLHLYDSISLNLAFKDLAEILSSSFLALESHTLRAYGRFTCDCAALGVPCVGSSNIAAQNRLFPDLTTDTNNVHAQHHRLQKLFDDKDFYRECAIFAKRNLDSWASFKASREHFESMVGEKLVNNDKADAT